jgi:glycerophosphoryl diester phosphodiesterase
MLESLRKPVIFAHRGSSAHAPENTIAAFKLAIDQGADAIELDAKLSLDGEVVVIHDQTVDRTTNGTGRVGRLLLEDLRRLDAGQFFANQFSGEKIPTLLEVLETVGEKLFINIELTNYSSANDVLVERVTTLVKERGLQKSVMFSSFNPFNLSKIKKLLPECPVAILALGGLAGWPARSFIGRWFSPGILHPCLTDLSAALIEREHKRGRRIHVWTVNDPVDLTNVFLWGVDGVFTDDPPQALRLREEK